MWTLIGVTLIEGRLYTKVNSCKVVSRNGQLFRGKGGANLIFLQLLSAYCPSFPARRKKNKNSCPTLPCPALGRLRDIALPSLSCLLGFPSHCFSGYGVSISVTLPAAPHPLSQGLFHTSNPKSQRKQAKNRLTRLQDDWMWLDVGSLGWMWEEGARVCKGFEHWESWCEGLLQSDQEIGLDICGGMMR